MDDSRNMVLFMSYQAICYFVISMGSFRGAMANSTYLTTDKTPTANTSISTFVIPVNGTPIGVTENCCGGNKYCSDKESRCSLCTCLCKDGFVLSTDFVNKLLYYGPGTKACLRFKGSLPTQPCDKRSDCVEGLICINRACKCPPPCKYVPEELICDCGRIKEHVNIHGPIIVGVILGMLIVFFWLWRISKTCDYYTAEKNRVRRMAEAETNVEIATLGNAYGTQHVMSPQEPRKPTNPYGTHVSPARSQMVAPATPAMPAIKAYGDNLIVPYQRNMAHTPPPQYPGSRPTTATFPATPSPKMASPKLNKPAYLDQNTSSPDQTSTPLPTTPSQPIMAPLGFGTDPSDQQLPSSAPGQRRTATPYNNHLPKSARF